MGNKDSILDGVDDSTLDEADPTLLEAARDGEVKFVQQYVDNKMFDLEEKDIEFGQAALANAAEEGHTDCVRILLEGGADVNAVDDELETALISAASEGHPEALKLLLKHKADVDLRDDDGRTALIYAAWHQHKKCVGLLLDAKASIVIKSFNGYTAAEYATKLRKNPKRPKDRDLCVKMLAVAATHRDKTKTMELEAKFPWLKEEHEKAAKVANDFRRCQGQTTMMKETIANLKKEIEQLKGGQATPAPEESKEESREESKEE